MEDSGWLNGRPMFYFWHLISILALDILGYIILLKFGVTWVPYIAAALCFVTAQVMICRKQYLFGAFPLQVQ